ncbi:MAG: NAD(P)/FAD-dependent oxidoreductase [Candidatus Bipolaricaulota bacterium]|nr:NAD(P)/FAD-dependent oxidoreductase [Candidatus Bipolaricaulota bacterium]MBS3792030.1 NAD(P)/FAD-dependent oxidoreductase [Candidatus Bipolaricaulota bacterium]
MNASYDVIVIGGGIIGTGVARALSRYKIDVGVLEKEPDVCWGTTKANSGIVHAGYDAKPGTAKASFSAPGNKKYGGWTENLSVPFKRLGSFVSTKDKSQLDKLENLLEQGEENGVEELEIITDRKRIEELEPNITEEVEVVLYAPTAGVVAPYKLTIALFENARENGVDFHFNAPVKGIQKGEDEAKFTIESGGGNFDGKYVINAAGIHSDEIAGMVGDDSFSIFPARGEYHLLDSEIEGYVRRINFPLPTQESKGILVTPAAEGSIIFGPNHQPLEEPSVATTKEGLEKVLGGAMKLFPDIDTGKIRTNFAGLRAKAGSDDFVIGESDAADNFVNVAGIQSPGLTAAPAISEHVVGLLEDLGLELIDDSDFDPRRNPIPKFAEMDIDEIAQYTDKYKAAKDIVCRCEEVTRAEIEEAIDRGATTLDGIKFRTRSRMGSCQGGFCTPRLIEILSDKLGVSPKEITKKGDNSYLLAEETKKGE